MAGLLNLGGFGAVGGATPPVGLLGPYYNQSDMRKQQLKQGLLAAGIGLLTGGKGSTGEVLGQGLAAGLQGANNAGINYKSDALGYNKLAMDMKEQKEKEEKKANLMKWVSSLPLKDQMLAQQFPELYAKQYLEQQAGGGDKYFGTPLPYGQNGQFKGYGLPSKNGEFKPLDAPPDTEFFSPYDKAFDQSRGKAAGDVQGAAAGNLPGAIESAEFVKTKIDDLLKNPNIDKAIGYGSWLGDAFVSNEVIDIRGRIKELSGGAFLEARQMLKGGGAITDFESTKAEQAYSRMEQAMRSSDEKTFKEALIDFRSALDAGISKLRATSGQPTVAPAVNQADPLSIR